MSPKAVCVIAGDVKGVVYFVQNFFKNYLSNDRQGIEFWSNVSDEEIDLAIESQEAQETGRVPSRVSNHYARGALQYLAPVLMDKLTKQEEFDDEDDWNPSKAASVCLMLLATCCEDEIVGHVLPFVNENIDSQNWRFRDAALMVFASILGGIEAQTLKPLVEQAMPKFIQLMWENEKQMMHK